MSRLSSLSADGEDELLALAFALAAEAAEAATISLNVRGAPSCLHAMYTTAAATLAAPRDLTPLARSSTCAYSWQARSLAPLTSWRSSERRPMRRIPSRSARSLSWPGAPAAARAAVRCSAEASAPPPFAPSWIDVVSPSFRRGLVGPPTRLGSAALPLVSPSLANVRHSMRSSMA